MNYNTTLMLAGGLFLVSSIFSLWVLRRQYKLYGKLNWFGVLIHINVYAFHTIFSWVIAWDAELSFPPTGPVGIIGMILMVTGFLIMIYAMDLFRTFSRWLGSRTPGLKTIGLYRWSRNPQFVGYALLYLGFFIVWWSNLAWLGMFSYIVLVYAITRVEEEHLERVYGAEYREYCARVPRYVGIPKDL